MRIALIAPSFAPVPPRGLGGPGLVVAELASALSAQGHDVTTFATGESRPAGRLRAHFERACWPPDPYADLVQAHFACREIRRSVPSFDVVHTHVPAALPFARFIDAPTICTVHHERVSGMESYYREFADVWYVMGSALQASHYEGVPRVRVVHHGLDPERYRPGEGAGGYVAFVGKLAKQSAPHVAVDAARAAGVPLVVAGQADWPDQEYYQDELEPRLSLHGVQSVADVGHAKRVDLLGGARALLLPLEGDEPMGLVIVEAMLCGTPVIASGHGVARELIDVGVTGFLAEGAEAMADAIRRVASLDRAAVRTRAIERFSTTRMAAAYLEVYADAIARYRESGARPSVVLPATPSLDSRAAREDSMHAESRRA